MRKKILTAGCEFLSSADSLYVFNDSPSGWKCAAARRAIGIEQFEYNPADEQWGFASWNDFFTRPFRDGQRPVASPDDDKIIVNACESTPYRLAIGVKRQDRFWIKSQPYSLQDMLANDDAVDQFVGGTGVPPTFRTADQIRSDPERGNGIGEKIPEFYSGVS